MLSLLGQFAAEATAEKTGLAVLGIDAKALLLQLITFLIIFFLIKKFALKPIVAALNQRRKTINDGIRLGRKMEAEQLKLEETVNKTLHKARAEADKIVAGAHQEAGDILRQAEDAATKKAEALLADANVRINESIKKARDSLESEVLELVAQASSAVIEAKVDAQKDKSLLAKALERARG